MVPDGCDMFPNTCCNTTTQLLMAQLAKLDVEEAVAFPICPGARMEIGNALDAFFTNWTDDQYPLGLIRPNSHFLCGNAGLSDNDCQFIGGLVQIAAQPESEFLLQNTGNAAVPELTDMAFLGFTFTGDAATFEGTGFNLPGRSLFIAQPGDYTFEGCIWSEWNGPEAVLASVGYRGFLPFTNEQLPAESISVTIKGSLFQDINVLDMFLVDYGAKVLVQHSCFSGEINARHHGIVLAQRCSDSGKYETLLQLDKVTDASVFTNTGDSLCPDSKTVVCDANNDSNGPDKCKKWKPKFADDCLEKGKNKKYKAKNKPNKCCFFC